MNDLIVAFSLGLAGSLHCVGMCSPLVLAIGGSAWWQKLSYNAGRISTYMIYGWLVAGFGNAFQWPAHQEVISLMLGLVMIILAIAGFSSVRLPMITPFLQRLSGYLKTRFSTLVGRRSAITIFLMGALNGMLPCGLTYLALTYCIILPEAWQGMTFMFAFGAGTLGVMFGLTSVISLIIRRNRLDFRTISIIMLMVMGVFFIGRATLNTLAGNTLAASHRVDAVCR